MIRVQFDLRISHARRYIAKGWMLANFDDCKGQFTDTQRKTTGQIERKREIDGSPF